VSITDKTAVTPPGPSGPVPRKPWHKRRWVRITGAISGALVVIIALTNHSGTSPAAATSPAKPAATAPAKSATPKAQAPKATPKRTKPAAPAAPANPTQAPASPAQTMPAAAAPAQPSSPAPVQSTQPTAPPAAATPAGCYPLSNGGTCYEPGEYCRNADHGVSGMAGDGEAITCEYNNGWRWEPASGTSGNP
jgi:hypothetical protein